MLTCFIVQILVCDMRAHYSASFVVIKKEFTQRVTSEIRIYQKLHLQ